jgi:beta-galactosidase
MIRASFDENWFVRRDDRRNESPKGPLTLPHDAMLTEARDPATKNGGNTGFFPGGIYRYSKTFSAHDEWRDRIILLEFEGVYEHSQVFLNGHLVGGRPYGYALFHVALQDHLDFGSDNLIEVVADNSSVPNSRWYTGSGIYRPTHLLVGGPVRIDPTGVRVSTTSLNDDSATINIHTTVINDDPTEKSITVVATVTTPTGESLPPFTGALIIPANSTGVLDQRGAVHDAELWSPETPQLHTITVELIDGAGTVDRATDEFGIRTITADSRNGLRINGLPVKLRGSAIHHDNGVIGAVALDAAEDRRVRLLKESGFNAIRSAHNPASRALLRACDRHGILVMDELADAWRRPKVLHDYSELFDEWWERDLEALVANSFNHPSVIMYSIGNEISETATPAGIEINRMLATRTRQLDPTRLVTNGINGFLNLIAPDDATVAKRAEAAKGKEEAPNKNLIRILNAIIGILDKLLNRIVRLKAVDRRTRDAFADLDVAGYNYMMGRYEIDAKLYPDRVIVGSETRSTQTAKIFKQIEHLPHVIGDFAWTGWDYIGEAGLAAKQYGTTKRSIYQPYPALLAGEPVIDITGFRQTQSYINEVAWHRATSPHIAVEPVNHSGEKSVKTGWRLTNSISSWSWEGCEGRIATVEVYAEAAKISLKLNDRSIATKAPSDDGNNLAKFTLPYEPGTLTAIAYAADGSEIGRANLVSAGKGLKLLAESEVVEIVADGKDLAYIPIAFTDDAGALLPLADRNVTVTVEGPGVLAGLGSGEPITTEAFASDTHSSYYGRALAVIRAGHQAGQITVTIAAEGCEPITTMLTAVATREVLA